MPAVMLEGATWPHLSVMEPPSCQAGQVLHTGSMPSSYREASNFCRRKEKDESRRKRLRPKLIVPRSMKFQWVLPAQPVATRRLDLFIHSEKIHLRAFFGLCPEDILVNKADIAPASKTLTIQKGSKHGTIKKIIIIGHSDLL